MKRAVLAMAAACLISGSLYAQTHIEGTVTDSKSGDVLPFVNIAISGTTVGTISDINGEFQLSVPDAHAGKDVVFSSVGYALVRKSMQELANQHAAIQLQPMDLNIEEVVVVDKSEKGRKVVKSVIDNASAKYVNVDYSYAGTYHSKVQQGGSIRNSSYTFNAYDSHGYSRSGYNNAFEALNYKFSQVNRDFKVNNYQLGLNYFDFVSGLDFMRAQLGVMNPYTLADFDFKIKSDDATKTVLEFICNKPGLLNTGACKPTKYSGTITVLKSDNVVLESEYVLECDNLSLQGMSVGAGANGTKGSIRCKITYGKFDGKYAMKSIAANIAVSGGAEGSISLDDEIQVTSANYKVPGKIKGKVFYSR